MRFALYYAPASSSLLGELGCRWLGRDALSQQKVRQDRFPGISQDRLHELTRTPRRYGLHGTLKAPFRLAADYDVEMLRSAIADFACRRPLFSMPSLVLRQINDFFCLCPEKQTLPLQSLAAACVQNFDRYRAAPTAGELARRRRHILTPVEKDNLAAWGYPYVLDQYRFHITLTTRISSNREKEVVYAALSDMFAPVLGEPIVMDAICLFIEPAPGQKLFCTDRFLFSSSDQLTENIVINANQKQQQNVYSEW
ncbi:MAG: DUF1045 domain-containing protein [Proteobacteria bacterium]|nr:DUF1045 domain-containing protein [Pseudomonadota bacterium]